MFSKFVAASQARHPPLRSNIVKQRRQPNFQKWISYLCFPSKITVLGDVWAKKFRSFLDFWSCDSKILSVILHPALKMEILTVTTVVDRNTESGCRFVVSTPINPQDDLWTELSLRSPSGETDYKWLRMQWRPSSLFLSVSEGGRENISCSTTNTTEWIENAIFDEN